MDAQELKKLITKSAGDRTKLIADLLAALEKVVGNVQKDLLARFIADWVDKLDIGPDGLIKNTLYNKRLLSTVDNVFSQYVKTDGIVIAKAIVDGVDEVMNFNGRYYKQFNTEAKLIPLRAQVKETMQSWLGMKGNGALEGNGYLAKLITDPRILADLKNFALKAVVSQQGYNSMKTELKTFIDGSNGATGLLEKYYRNFTFDTYSQVDRAAAQVYAVKLDLNYAVYEGGIIKTSRTFCREHEGKVYTREEIAAMNPKTAIPDNYNPFTDMGGYGCRHHWNWISYEVAVLYRPDLQPVE